MPTMSLGIVPNWQFNSDPAQNPALTPFDLHFSPGTDQSTLQPFGVMRGGVPLSGFGDAAGDCLASAQAQTAPFDGAIDDLNKTWKPTGTYTTDDVNKLVSVVTAVNQKALDLINQQQQAIASSLNLPDVSLLQRRSPSISSDELLANCGVTDSSCLGLAAFIAQSGIPENLNQGLDDIARNSLQGALYSEAAVTAIAQSQQAASLVQAPLLKDWVIKSLQDVSSAMNAASDAACLIQNIPSMWAPISELFNAVIGVAKTVLGVAEDVVKKTIQIGGNVIKAGEQIIEGALGFGLFITRYGLWIGLGLAVVVGGIILWPRIKRLRSEGLPFFKRSGSAAAP